MNSQKAPQTVEVSQPQYTGINVDVLAIWRHTDGEDFSLIYAGGNTVESQRHVSMIRRVQESVL